MSHAATRRRVSSCVVVLCCAFGVAASAAATATLDDVLAGFRMRQHAEARFVERHFLSLVKKPLESQGLLIYDAPDTLEKRTLLPHPETLRLEGDTVTVERGHGRHTLDLRKLPQLAPLVDSIRATLAGDRAALERLFRLRFAATPTGWSLELEPLDAGAARIVRAVRIAGALDQIRELEVVESDGDRSVMTLQAATPQ